MKQHILIIEDDTFLGEMLKKKLETAGYVASLETDGAKGLEEIIAQEPDLILLDIMLPTKDGFQILEEKQKLPSIAKIPVIIVSNSGQPVEISRVVALGVKDYFVKAQVDPDEIVEKVRTQLASSASHSIEGKRVLMVEDDKFLSDLLGMKLTQEKCEILRATTGQEALKHAKESAPDVILLDIVLPGMDGFAILTELKRDDKTKNIPVLVLSNLGQEEDIAKAKELGATGFFVKAMLTPEQIITEIRKALDGGH